MIKSAAGLPAAADLHLTDMPALASALSQARAQLTAWAENTGLDADQIDDMALAVYEAMANVVDHAYDRPGGTFDLLARRRADCVTVTITDRGRWKPPADGGQSWRGRGLLIMERAARVFELTRHAMGTTVSMSWAVQADAPGSR